MKKRTAGVLLHITSLPGKYGVGTMGKEAYKFVDWMKSSGLGIWQVLPLVPTNYGDSPYQSVSSTALNYYLIDFDILANKGLLQKEDYENEVFSYSDRVDFSLLFNKKVRILKKAFYKFDINEDSFKEFFKKGEYNDFALFMTIKELNGYVSWNEWSKEYQNYSKELEKKIIIDHFYDYMFWQWTQYEFLNEWNDLKHYANEKGIEIMGDMPLYVAYDSVEVWKTPEMFKLKPNKERDLVAGCPPDVFSADGQLWGNPVYDWDYMKNTNYNWWNSRIEKTFRLYDILRIDHFRGFDKYYAIDASETTARNGRWLDGPKFDLFKDKTNLNIVAEDLGFIDEGVRLLMRQTGYPGMKILEFAFDGTPDNEHKPTNTAENFIVYTGTHDNMPLCQYINDLKDYELNALKNDVRHEAEVFNVNYRGDDVESLNQTIIELAFASRANTCILPMQDLLNQYGSSRMNLPSTVSTDNWSYRIKEEDLSKSLSCMISSYVSKYGRK